MVGGVVEVDAVRASEGVDKNGNSNAIRDIDVQGSAIEVDGTRAGGSTNRCSQAAMDEACAVIAKPGNTSEDEGTHHCCQYWTN